jgi:RNA polymerase sigma-70 factor, ECF subfamily
MNYSEANHIRIIAQIFEEHGEYIRKIIYFKIQNESLVDDFFQECFLSLIQKPLPYQNIKNIKSYLFRVIHNDMIDAVRRIERHKISLSRYLEEVKSESLKDNPENILIESEERDRMFDKIEKHLSDREAQAITLRYRDNYTNQEMAKKLGVKSSSISRYICTGLKKARVALNENGV